MNHPNASGLPLVVRWALVLLALAAAVGLSWLSVTVHLARSCLLDDTPYLPLCTDASGESKPERIQRLRARLTSNPGDSAAWILLANADNSASQQASFKAAAALAPTDPNVLMWRAGDALKNNRMEEATGLLVQLVDYWRNADAARVLAAIVASDQGLALLRPHILTAARWLPQVLASMTTLKLPTTAAVPIFVEASAKNAIGVATTNAFIRSLKAAGYWADAYGLWLAQQQGPVPLLHNGAFEDRFQADGFDWEVTPTLASRAGAIVSQRGARGRGQVLEVEYTGKSIAIPIIRQYVFLPPGRYQFQGQYMASKLRMEQGLAWTVRCTNPASTRPLVGRSEALPDTAGNWQTFKFDVTVPADCGVVASLQLETAAPYEATVGFKGRSAFDSFELRPAAL